MAAEAIASAMAQATAAAAVSETQVAGIWNLAAMENLNVICVILILVVTVGLLGLKREAGGATRGKALKKQLGGEEAKEAAELAMPKATRVKRKRLTGKEASEKAEEGLQKMEQFEEEEAKAAFVVMDGGMGCLTMEMGVARDPKLWSARGLIDEQYHGIVVAAHKKYIEAGARMITTNNYAVQPVYYRNAFPSDWEMRIVRDCELAARLAVEARSTAKTSHPVQVLGSLPPLCESHRPDLCEDFIRDEGEEFVKKTYRCIAQALLRGGPVDAFVAETMNNWDEARLAIEAVKDLGCPIWVCFQGSFRDRALVNKPEELGLEYARKVLDMKTKGYPIAGFGMNCAPPEDTYAGLEVLEHAGMMENFKKAGMHFMVYANCNEQTHVSGGYRVERSFVTKVKSREDLFGDMCGAYTNWCRRFAALGVTHLGGCCGSTPDHISSLQHEAELQQEEKEDNSSEGLSD